MTSKTAVKWRGDNHFFVKTAGINVKIIHNSVLYVEGTDDHVNIVCKEKAVTAKITIDQLEDLLPETLFLRIHRSYIIYVPNVDTFSDTSIEIPGKQLPIGADYKDLVTKTLAKS